MECEEGENGVGLVKFVDLAFVLEGLVFNVEYFNELLWFFIILMVMFGYGYILDCLWCIG